MKASRLFLAALLVAGCATRPAPPTDAERQALAPTGVLRAAMLASSPTHAAAPAVGRELARRLGVPFEAVTYNGDAALIGSAGSGRWDIIFTGASSEREREFDFSAPYAQIDTGYLVAPRVAAAGIQNVDRPGIRVAVQERGSADRIVTALLAQATVVRVATLAQAFEMLRSGRVDAVAANKTNLFPASAAQPGSRVLDGSIGASTQAIGVPKGRPAAAAYVRRFVDDAKASGFIRNAVEEAAVRGLVAAP